MFIAVGCQTFDNGCVGGKGGGPLPLFYFWAVLKAKTFCEENFWVVK